MESQPQLLRLHPEDNVAVALVALEAGAVPAQPGPIVRETIAPGHKLAFKPIPAGTPVRKYGQIIGFAAIDIEAGEHVHTHNVVLKAFERDYAFSAQVRPTVLVPELERATFEGYLRPDGRVGTRNYLGVLATVNCATSVAHFIAQAFPAEELAAFPHVDGIVALGHGQGCGTAAAAEDLAMLQRAISGYARHPNFAGLLLVSLGCEYNHLDCLCQNMGLTPGPLLKTLCIQDLGGTKATVAAGVAALKEMLPRADQARRQTVPAKHLVLGVECGGSDAYSGLTANPALGAAADVLISHGGTAILSETPEIYGAEHLLTRRAVSREVADKLLERIHWWERQTALMGGAINNNPTPGNKAGGLTTILEKSLGAATKGGTTNLVEVVGFAEPVHGPGLVFMDTPGYDPVSVTGLVAGGANLVAFTTGRGSVFGGRPVPVLKLASNIPLYERMTEDMDVNCGLILDGSRTLAQMGRVIFDLLLATASGRKTKSEELAFGDQEFVPWTTSTPM